MCGIAGLVDPRRKHSHEELSCFAVSMANRLRHRGPDDSGVYADGETGLALGFRRLSIQDCSPKGAQPMTSASGRYVIVYNGEVYNFRKIRQILESEGFDRWRGQSDTEVVLAAFDRFGFARSLALFQGMFAFALLESVRRLYAGLQSFRSMSRMDASLMKASALRLRFSQSLASRRQRLSQAMVRSTTQRLGWTTKPFTRSDRLTISVSRSGRMPARAR